MRPLKTVMEVINRYESALSALGHELRIARLKNIYPLPKLGLSQWTERYAVLSKETNAQLRTLATPGPEDCANA